MTTNQATFEKSQHMESSERSSLNIIRLLCKSTHPVFLAKSGSGEEEYALKVFPYTQAGISASYIKESRVQNLEHPNIVNILESCPKEIDSDGQIFSYTLSEYEPLGDLCNLTSREDFKGDPKLARTFFRNLIDGVAYLHENGIAHLDLKPENILIGKDLQLKIGDYDTSYMRKDGPVTVKGTENYRPPELLLGCCKKPKAADIYSIGIVVFLLYTGCLPYLEKVEEGNVDLFKIFALQDESFWRIHSELSDHPEIDDQDFKDLFFGMTKINPKERVTIEEIRSSAWYQKEVYEFDELERVLSS